MNPRERIAKLEAILARVTARAGAPRETNGSGASHAGAQPLADEPIISSEPITPLEVDVSDVTGATDAARAQPVAAAESRERMIAAPAQLVEESDSAPTSVETEVRPPPEPLAADARAASEIALSTASEVIEVTEVSEDEPPASSRRPIAIEPKLEELAFGDAAPAETVAHTAPPESGRQVAAAPVDLDFDGEFTGVRPREPEEASVTVLAEPPKAKIEAEVRSLAPEATAAKLPATAAVAFVGAPPVFKPKTFGELLDATLTL